MKLQIPNKEVQELLTDRTFDYPKYATQIMNLANQNAQGTRPNVVGQMSELIQEFGSVRCQNGQHGTRRDTRMP